MTSNQEFDDFLRDATERDAEQEQLELLHANIQARYDEAIQAFNPMPRFLDSDPEAQDTLKAAAIESYVVQFRDAVTIPDGMDQDDFDKLIYDQAEHEVRKLSMNEAALQTQIIIGLSIAEYAAQNPEEDVDAQAAAWKKQLIAEMLVGEGLSMDDPWVSFANNAMPGDKFNPALESDQAYMIDALQAHANSVDEKERTAAINSSLMHIINPDFTSDPDDGQAGDKNIEAIRLSAKLIGIGLFDRDRYERESQVFAACAEFGIEQSVVADILIFLEDTYPAK